MRLSSLLLALLPLLSAACGGGSDPGELTTSASRALGKGDFATAQKEFDQALEAIGDDPANPDYLRAKLGAIEARTKDAPDEAVSMFLELSRKMPSKVNDADFNRIGGRLGASGHFPEAIELVQAGMAAYPESPHLAKLVQTLGDAAKKSGSGSDVMNKLAGLGYAGGD